MKGVTMSQSIPSEIRKEFEWIDREVLWLHGKWKIYCQLFFQSETRRNLLKMCGGACFYTFQQALLEAIQLSLAKLTDPPKGRSNLSLESLQERIEELEERRSEKSDEKRSEKLMEILCRLKAKCKPIRKLRNKHLAHSDLKTALERGANLEPVSQEMIEDALEVLREYVNTIQQHYLGTSTGYGILENFSADANHLVEVISQGVNFQSRFPELVKEGKITAEDLKGPWTGA
jgi:hypothetical protein